MALIESLKPTNYPPWLEKKIKNALQGKGVRQVKKFHLQDERNLLEPPFNNKSECMIHWQVMYRFQQETHYTACHHWYIFRPHNQNSNDQMSIMLDLT